MSKCPVSSPTGTTAAMQSGMIRAVARTRGRRRLSVREKYSNKDPENYVFMFDHVHMPEIHYFALVWLHKVPLICIL